MRLAIYALLAAYVLSTLWGLIRASVAPASVVAAYLFGAIWLLAYVAFVAGLWRFGCVPASTGAARPARQSFICFASGQVLSLLCMLVFVGPAPALRAHGDLLIGHLLLWPIANFVLTCAGLGLLVRALGAALRSLGDTPPAWAPKALGACIAWWILSIALPIAGTSVGVHVPRDALSPMWWLAVAGGGAFALALASVMGRTSRALARQESPETALG